MRESFREVVKGWPDDDTEEKIRARVDKVVEWRNKQRGLDCSPAEFEIFKAIQDKWANWNGTV